MSQTAYWEVGEQGPHLPPRTYREVCEAVAAFINSTGGSTTAEKVWNVSTTGELWPVHALYDWAIEYGMPCPPERP